MPKRLSTFVFLSLVIAPPLSAAPPRLQIEHQGIITGVAWSASGLQIATASQDGSVRVLDTATGKELFCFASGHAVRGLALAPDGKTLALSQVGKGVSFWNIVTGQRLESNGYTNYAPERMAFTPNSRTAMGGGGGELFIWTRAGGIITGGSAKGVRCAAVAPDAAIGGWVDVDGLLTLYENVPGGVRDRTLQVGKVRCISIGPGGKLLAIGGEDKGVELWDLTVAAPKKIGSLTGMPNPAKLSCAADGSALAAVDAGGTTVRVWDLKRQRTRRQVIHSHGQVGYLALSPDGKLLATTGSSGNALLLWNVATRELTQPGPSLELSANVLAGLWTDLADQDEGKSDAAWRKLAAAGEHAIAFLKERIRPVAVPLDPKRVEKLLSELDSEHFATREKATRELMNLGELAIVPLQRFLEKPPSVEAHQRAHMVFKDLSEPVPTPNHLRAVEVLELLEYLRSPKAVALLQEIERDALIPQIRREARSALQRAAAARDEKK